MECRSHDLRNARWNTSFSWFRSAANLSERVVRRFEVFSPRKIFRRINDTFARNDTKVFNVFLLFISKVIFCNFRDPSLRLGAWSNPPTDIMESNFFKPIDWASIYDRRLDGPWIPPEEPLLAKKRRELQRQDSSAADGESTNVAGWEDNGVDVSVAKTVHAQAPNVVSTNRQASETTTPRNPVSSEVSTNDQSELLHVRDSIFATSMMPQDNIIQDWSFVDSAALSPAVSQGRRGGSSTPLSAGKSQNRL